MFEHLNRFFSYQGLRSYQAKFEPQWAGSFIVYQGGCAGYLARLRQILPSGSPLVVMVQTTENRDAPQLR
jgi:lysylphosphatidylglycerol synthetase-like protein (DUF2156 family)